MLAQVTAGRGVYEATYTMPCPRCDTGCVVVVAVSRRGQYVAHETVCLEGMYDEAVNRLWARLDERDPVLPALRLLGDFRALDSPAGNNR